MNDELGASLEVWSTMVDALQAAPTAAERALRAYELWRYGNTVLLPSCATERRSATRELRAIGYSLSEIAELFGVTDSRVCQIIKGPP